MQKKTSIILAAILVVLGVVYMVTRPTALQETTYAPPDIDLKLDPFRVVKIEIHQQDRYVRLERIQGRWRMTVPVNYLADYEPIQQLLDGMVKFRIVGLASTNPDNYAVFGVDQQGTTVLFTSDEGTVVSVIFGKAGQAPKQVFVRPLASKSVYLAHGFTPSLVNKELRDWRQKTLYRGELESVKLISVKSGTQNYTLRLKNNRWAFEGKPVSGSTMASVLSPLLNLRAEDFVDTALIITTPARFEVEMMADKPVRLSLYGGAGKDRFFMKTSESSSICVVDKSLVDKLEYLVTQISPKPVDEEKPVASAQPATPPASKTVAQTQPSSPTPSPQPATGPTPQPRGNIEEEGTLTIYIVKKGETMASIAQKLNVTTEQLKRWNQLQKETLTPGTELYVFVWKK